MVPNKSDDHLVCSPNYFSNPAAGLKLILVSDSQACNTKFDQIHVAYLHFAREWNSHFAATLERRLNRSERERLDRMKQPEARQNLLLSRWLVHQLIERKFPDIECDWTLQIDSQGRPLAVSSDSKQSVHYSLSHRKQFIVAAVRSQGSVGIDAEPIDQTFKSSFLEFAFTDLERQQFKQASSVGISTETSVQIAWRWTVKEAVSKMTGRIGIDSIRAICTASLDRFAPMAMLLEHQACVQSLDLSPSFVTSLAIESNDAREKYRVECVDAGPWMDGL